MRTMQEIRDSIIKMDDSKLALMCCALIGALEGFEQIGDLPEKIKFQVNRIYEEYENKI